MTTTGCRPAADATERGVSLGVMSKSFALAGLRIGWLATRDRDLLERCASFKDYTTICASAPSEILAIIGLRARETVLDRSRGIVAANMERLDAFFDEWADRFTWVRPRGGSIGFPRLTVPGVGIDDWAAGLVESEGVLLLPGSQFGFGGNHFRLGFGRTDLPEALERLEGVRRQNASLTLSGSVDRPSAPHRNHPYSPRLHHVPDVRMGLGQDLHRRTVAPRNRPARDPEPRRLLSPFGVGGHQS